VAATAILYRIAATTRIAGITRPQAPPIGLNWNWTPVSGAAPVILPGDRDRGSFREE